MVSLRGEREDEREDEQEETGQEQGFLPEIRGENGGTERWEEAVNNQLFEKSRVQRRESRARKSYLRGGPAWNKLWSRRLKKPWLNSQRTDCDLSV